MAWSERQRELRRRRHRKAKIAKYKLKAPKASQSEKEQIARKLRLMTPGAQDIIDKLELEPK